MELYHAFKVNDERFLYLSNFKQLFQISDEEYECLNNEDCENIDDILNEYKEYTTEQDLKMIKPDSYDRYGLFLCVSNACNAKCVYCFAGQGNYGKVEGIMDFETSRKAIDFFMDEIPKDKSAHIIFFGGEPLLSYNLLKETTKYVQENYGDRKYQFHVVTNATLLTNDMIDFLSENNFNMGISIDGGECVQNEQRPLRNGLNSYKEATKNLDYVLENISSVHARGTFSNFDNSLVEAYKDLIELGFKEVNIPPDILNKDMNKDFNKLLSELDDLYSYVLDYASKNDDFPFGLFIEDIRRIFMAKLDVEYSCGLGLNIFSIDINGDIYPCHRFSSESEFVLGNVKRDGKIKNINYESLECKDCWNQYTCSHGCAYNDYVLMGDRTKKNPYWCMYSKKMTELSLALITKLKDLQIENML